MAQDRRICADPQPVEQGDPAADGRAFRRCLGQFATGVTVVTACHGDELAGMAVNSFAAVSLEPPLVLWSIRRVSRSAAAFLQASHFAINVLGANQVEISQRFGSGQPDRFVITPWTAGTSGAPLLHGALAHLECRRAAVHEGGDHLILIGHVERFARFDGGPLLFSQGQYAWAEPLSAASPAAPAASAPEVIEATGAREDAFLTLLSQTSQRLSAEFQQHRQPLGLNLSTARVLRRLADGACGLDALEQATYLGELAIEDALEALGRLGHVSASGNARFAITASGLAASQAMAQRSAEFTREKLRGVDERDIAAARRLLIQLQVC